MKTSLKKITKGIASLIVLSISVANVFCTPNYTLVNKNCKLDSTKLEFHPYKSYLTGKIYPTITFSILKLSSIEENLFEVYNPKKTYRGKKIDPREIVDQLLSIKDILDQYSDNLMSLELYVGPISGSLKSEIQAGELQRNILKFTKLYEIYRAEKRRLFGHRKFLKKNLETFEEMYRYFSRINNENLNDSLESSSFLCGLIIYLEYGCSRILKYRKKAIRPNFVDHGDKIQLIVEDRPNSITNQVKDLVVHRIELIQEANFSQYFEARILEDEVNSDCWFIAMGFFQFDTIEWKVYEQEQFQFALMNDYAKLNEVMVNIEKDTTWRTQDCTFITQSGKINAEGSFLDDEIESKRIITLNEFMQDLESLRLKTRDSINQDTFRLFVLRSLINSGLSTKNFCHSFRKKKTTTK